MKQIYNKYNGNVYDKNSLKDDKSFCNKCKGKGVINDNDTLSQLAYICPKCNGDGIVDWIEQVVGKPRDTSIFHGTSGYISYPSAKG